MTYVYKLLDKNKLVFYIGRTKNLEVRLLEHEKLKNASAKKIYRTRGSIKFHGYLMYTYCEFESDNDAKTYEKAQIKFYKPQLINVVFGKETRSSSKSKGKPIKCLRCGLYFKKIKVHRCET